MFESLCALILVLFFLFLFFFNFTHDEDQKEDKKKKDKALGSPALLCHVPYHLVARRWDHALHAIQGPWLFCGGTGGEALQREYRPIPLHGDPPRTSTWVVFSISTTVPRMWEGVGQSN